MKLRTKFILFVTLFIAICLTLSWSLFQENRLLFILSELVIILLAALAWKLYRQMIHPLKLLMQGIQAIKDKDFTVKMIPTGKYEMDQLIEVYNNMIEELRNERTLQQEQHYFLEKLIQTSPTGILILDYDNLVQQINPKAQEILDQASDNLLSLIQGMPTGTSRTIRVGGIHTFKLQKSHFMDRGFPRHFIMLEELTTELLAAEKNVYGKVIRMIAHEVNNTIGPVNSIIQSTHQEHLSPLISQALDAAYQRNQHLNQFVRNFADLVKLPPPHKTTLDLHQVLRTVYTIMKEPARHKGIELLLSENAPAPGAHVPSPGARVPTPGARVPTSDAHVSTFPFLLQADQVQLEQALINIVKNAIEAIEAPDGCIEITPFPKAQKLLITDNGKGISNAEEHLFSPFFSTKKDGQGIGLTLVREILLSHGYDFSLSTPATGRTEFWIYFNR
jgi:nitrogen fixation/metabolism regulation signal transduction histidine kinase